MWFCKKFLWIKPCHAPLLKACSSQILFGLKPSKESLADLLVLTNYVHSQNGVGALGQFGQPVNLFLETNIQIDLVLLMLQICFKILATVQNIVQFLSSRKTKIPCRGACCTATKGKPFKVVNAVVCAISALNLNFLIFYEIIFIKAVNVHLDTAVNAILLWNSDPESENLWKR